MARTMAPGFLSSTWTSNLLLVLILCLLFLVFGIQAEESTHISFTSDISDATKELSTAFFQHTADEIDLNTRTLSREHIANGSQVEIADIHTPEKVKQPPPASDDTFNTYAAKGCNLLYMMAANADDALTRMKLNPALKALASSQSKYENAGDLQKYGWTPKKQNTNLAYLGINAMLTSLRIDTDPKNFVNSDLTQKQEFDADGKHYAASGGQYIQYINAKAGLAIPYYIYSPKFEAQRLGVKGLITPLNQYSNVLFLEYNKQCGRVKPKADVKGLKYFLFHNIENPDTWAIALKAMQSKSPPITTLPEWPGVEFSMNSPGGKALLATQIGRPLAWMLIQHKVQLGLKTAVKVTVFRNAGAASRDTDQPYTNLLFEVADVDPSQNHCEPANACCCPPVPAT